MKNYPDETVGVVIDPSIKYPGFPYDVGVDKLEKAIRKALGDIGLIGNDPLKPLVKRGDTVVIKPNWVRDINPVDSDISSLITHTSVIKIIIDFVLKSLAGDGKIIVADAPIQGCNFDKLIKKTRILDLFDQYKSKYPGVVFEVVDLRKTKYDDGIQKRENGDPKGYSLIDLGDQSLFSEVSDKSSNFRVSMYDHNLMHEHHNSTKNEYLISNTVLMADLVINVPKMKCHIKAGLTGAMKNLVGINGHKEYLPHYILGSSDSGGDQYIKKNRIREYYNGLYDYYWSNYKGLLLVKRCFLRLFIGLLALLSAVLGGDILLDGGWCGNETVPRMVVDINNVLYFYDRKLKRLSKKPVRKALTIVDGIVSGEGNGPLSPIRKDVGVLLAGFNPLYVDIVMGYLMGYSVLEIKTIFFGLRHPLSMFYSSTFDIGKLVCGLPDLNFVKPKYWRSLNRQ